MPTSRITAAASELIRQGAKAKKSQRALVETVREQLGIELDQSTVARHLKKFAKKGPKTTPQKAQAAEKRLRGALGITIVDVNAGIEDLAPTLDEIEAIERELTRLQTLLAGDLPNRDRVALTAELRQGMKQLRFAKAAASKDTGQRDREIADLVTKLKRAALRNVTDFGEAPDEIPEVGGATGGERDAQAPARAAR